jgi:hypothetical protein
MGLHGSAPHSRGAKRRENIEDVASIILPFPQLSQLSVLGK